jgi:hypothetical protein
MAPLEKLAACAGTWRGTNKLHDPKTGAPDTSESTAAVTPILDGKFLRLDYHWKFQGKAQEGMLLIGYEAESRLATGQWIDTWHMGDKVMACAGKVGRDGDLSLRGSYVMEGERWGWIILITPGSDRLEIEMFNITPKEKREHAVKAAYERAIPAPAPRK